MTQMIESVGGNVKPLASVPDPDLEIRGGAVIQTVVSFSR